MQRIIKFIKKLARKNKEDKVRIHAAEAAFFIIIAAIPTVMLFLSLLSFFPVLMDKAREFSFDFLTPQVSDTVDVLLTEIHAKASGAVLSISTITALWSASRGLLSIIAGLNAVYGTEEKRGYIKLRAVAVLYVLGLMLTLILTLVLLVFGGVIVNGLIEIFPVFADLTALFALIRWLFGFCLLVFFFWALYSFAPLHDTKPGFLSELPGAVMSAAGWLGFSALYSFYINNFADYSYLYGSLAAIVLLMLWLFICMNIMFFGAEINVLLRQRKNNNKGK